MVQMRVHETSRWGGVYRGVQNLHVVQLVDGGGMRGHGWDSSERLE